MNPTTPSGPAAPRGTVPPADAREPVRHPEAPEPGARLGSHYEYCFGCGSGQPHGLQMDIRAGEGVSVTAEFTVREAHQGAPGLAHGGVLAAALDETMGSLSWLLRSIVVTGHLETDYLRPVPVGTELHLSAQCTAEHGRKVFITGQARAGSPQGPVAVRARALFVRVDTEHFTRHGRRQEIDAVISDPDRLKAARAFEVNP